MRRVIVTGSRGWVDRTTIWCALNPELDKGPFILVHGAAKGADDIADRWAWGMLQQGYEIEVEAWPARNFTSPLARNQHMARLGADVCHAFPLKGGTGTRHMMTRCYAAGIWVVNHGYQPYTLEAREYAKAYG